MFLSLLVVLLIIVIIIIIIITFLMFLSLVMLIIVVFKFPFVLLSGIIIGVGIFLLMFLCNIMLVLSTSTILWAPLSVSQRNLNTPILGCGNNISGSLSILCSCCSVLETTSLGLPQPRHLLLEVAILSEQLVDLIPQDGGHNFLCLWLLAAPQHVHLIPQLLIFLPELLDNPIVQVLVVTSLSLFSVNT